MSLNNNTITNIIKSTYVMNTGNNVIKKEDIQNIINTGNDATNQKEK